VKRSTIVNGEYEPTDAEAKIEGGEELAKAGDKEKDIKGIPKFWLTAMKNNASLSEAITAPDEGALEYLHDVKYVNLEGEKQGFSVSFHFRENPYFTDSVLTKVYYLVEDELYNDLVFDHAEGSKINWKAGKNLTVKIVKKQPKAARGGGGRGRRGGAGAARTTTVEEPCESFFNFFTPPVRPEANDEEEDEEDDEENAIMDEMLEADFELGCIFKDKLVPHSVLWFTGEAQEYEDEFGDEFDYDFGDEDDEDEEEDDEEEEEEEERPKKGRGPPPKKSAGGKGGALPPPSAKGAPGPQPQQPECKQQ